MNNPRALLSTAASLVCAMLALANPAAAQDYPTRPVRLVIPFPPGGSNDVVGRLIAMHLAERLGKQVVVDNRGGAGGVIGTEVVAKSPADGYTLLVISMAHAVNPWLYKLTYDPIKDFAPIALLAKGANVLVVHPSLPVKTVKDLIDLAKAKPGQLNFASSGNGTSIHLAGELFKTMAGVSMVHVPYKGSAPAIADLLGGQVSCMFDNMPSSLPHIKAGKLRAIAVTSARRSPAMPELPTIAEAGLPGYEAASWFGLLAPAGTPREIVTKLNHTIVESLKTPEMKERLSSQGAEPVGDSPEEFAAYIRSEIAKWAKVVKASGAKLD